MNNKQTQWIMHILGLALLLCLVLHTNVFAQQGFGEQRWLRIGTLQAFFSDQGSEAEASHTLSWPAQYGIEQTHTRARAMWLGCENFYDPVAKTTYSHKCIGVGPRLDPDHTNQLPEMGIKLVGKFDHPVVRVDGANATLNTLYDVLDEMDPDLPADRAVVVDNVSSLGLSIRKTVYGWSQQNHDDYFIEHYRFINNGIIDKDSTVYAQKLEGLYFALNDRASFCGVSILGVMDQGDPRNWGSWSSLWGLNCIMHTMGTDPKAADFEMRARYAYGGPTTDSPVGYDDDWGVPNVNKDGYMSGTHWLGSVALHVDTSPQDRTDDLYQPSTTQYIESDMRVTKLAMNQYDPTFMDLKYEHLSAGHPAVDHRDLVGDDYPSNVSRGPGGESPFHSYGPFTMEIGDTLNIILAEGVGGLSQQKNVEVSSNWYQWYWGFSKPKLIMPDGSETTDFTGYKKAWFFTCEDSMLKVLRTAVAHYQSGYTVPDPPPAPELFEVKSGGDRISLSWADNATSWPNFDGYEIYRSEGTVLDYTTVYEKIWECSGANVVHQFDDTTATRGFDYYYYIVTKDDGSTNDLEPGKPLVSSLFWTVTTVPATLQRQAGKSLEEVRVVPNPYDIRSRSLQFGDESQYDRIAFYGLPGECTVKVFTERGDLIWKKEHIDGSGDELWDSLTSSRQIIVSGIYILVVETPEGDSVYRKFVIIR